MVRSGHRGGEGAARLRAAPRAEAGTRRRWSGLAVTVAVVAALASAVIGAVPAGAARAEATTLGASAAPPSASPSTVSAGGSGESAASATLDLDWRSIPGPMPQVFTSQGIGEQFSSPAVGDLFGDGGTEVVVGGVDGLVRIYDGVTGALRSSFPVSTVPGVIASSPALADLEGQGQFDIVVGFMPAQPFDYQVPLDTPTVAAFRPDGTRLWAVRTCTFPGKPCDVFASPAIADIDGSGVPDVVITSQDHYLHVLSGTNGAELPGFPYFLYDTSWSSPAVADLYGDGKPEIVVAADLDVGDCAGRPTLACAPGTYGSIIRVVSAQGVTLATHVMPGEIAISSPAVGHVAGPGTAAQIVIGSGAFFSSTNPADTPASERVWAFDAGLNPLPGWPVTLGGRTIASPALADVDGSGLETVFTTAEDGRVYALSGTGAVRWSVCGRSGGAACGFADGDIGLGRAAPVVADVNGDGRLDVLAVTEGTLDVLDAASGAVEQAVDLNRPGVPSTFVVAATPTVASVGGRAVVYLHGLADLNTDGARDGGDGDLLVRLSSPAALGPAPWPRFHHDNEGSGTDDAHRYTASTGPPGSTGGGCASGYGFYVTRLYQDLLGVPSTAGQLAAACAVLGGHPGAPGRVAVAAGLVGSPTWITSVLDGLYRKVLGRSGDPEGVQFWRTRMLGGEAERDVAIWFYGSAEQYARWGGTATDPTPYLTQLYSALLDRAPDPAGLAYWVGRELVTGPETVAAAFYQADESRSDRVTAQYEQLLCRAPDPAGLAYWAGRLVTDDDLALTLDLVTSDEYVARAGALPPCTPGPTAPATG